MTEDILDEYLKTDRVAVPREETIPEEDNTDSIVLDRFVQTCVIFVL